jgi:hypothetical protein
MKIGSGYLAIIVVFLLILVKEVAAAQIAETSVIWIKVYGQSSAVANMEFGNSSINTFGLDTAASFPSEFRENEPPPPPPTLDCIWKPIRAGQFGTFRGLLDRDYRDLGNSVRVDTFKLYFLQQDNPTQTISFKWPDCNYLYNHRCDSMFLVDLTGHIPRIDMFNQDSLAIPAAGDSNIISLMIYKYGTSPCCVDCDDCYRTCTAGNEDIQISPLQYSLSQNYPNPFNPTTRIQYSVASRQYVSIKIYDVLGREVATLVNETKVPWARQVECTSIVCKPAQLLAGTQERLSMSRR